MARKKNPAAKTTIKVKPVDRKNVKFVRSNEYTDTILYQYELPNGEKWWLTKEEVEQWKFERRPLGKFLCVADEF